MRNIHKNALIMTSTMVVLILAGIFVLLGSKNILSENIDKSNSEKAAFSYEMLDEARDYGGGSGCIMRSGSTIYQWGDTKKLYDLKSTTKSIGITALGLAIKDKKIKITDSVKSIIPEFGNHEPQNGKKDWYNEVTLYHLATHTAGFDKGGGYSPLLFRPGTAWAYSDGGSNWLADCLTYLYKDDLNIVLTERVFSNLNITHSDLKWRKSLYREKEMNGIIRREFGSGISANVRAMSQIGNLYLKGGKYKGKQLIPSAFVDKVRQPIDSLNNLTVKNNPREIYENASKHYGLLWWNNADGAINTLPRDAFWSWGLHDSTIIVIPSLDMVIARAGKKTEAWGGNRKPNFYKIFEPFITPIVEAVNYGSPYPNSPVIANIVWENAEQIKRAAKGSDNWPTAWAADDTLYAAYGDGKGFDENLKNKLSMGLAKIEDGPKDFKGNNIPSKAEQYGDGRKGLKASGLLSIKDKLYMWVRNANKNGEQSRLAWSKDQGNSWQWAPWVFKDFGYCTFIDYGKNFSDARDDFVYIVSHDNPNAYESADRFILMRVPKEKINIRDAYQFLSKLNKSGEPSWTMDIKKRVGVFNHRGNCHRSGISYNSKLNRYFWWQSRYKKGEDGRYSRRFGVFDAPEPWGPWTTVYYTNNWDVNAGETGSFPTKWISDDGKSMHLVFSGDDYLSVRKANLVLSPIR